MYHDLTKESISRGLLLFALPMMAGNLLQQLYNVADTLIIGRVEGSTALAAVGSAYTLMTFLTSIFLGLSMGSGALFSMYRGQGNHQALRSAILHGLLLILGITALINGAVYVWMDGILSFLQVPPQVWEGMKEYLLIVFSGLIATSVYNFFACLLRALGNSTLPLVFLGISALLNIGLDIVFVALLRWGIRGAGWATVIAQYVSAVGLTLYVLIRCRELLPGKEELRFRPGILRDIAGLSFLTCLQQSVMNFGILLVQGLVNSFGPTVMAAFAAAVKIDTFAYLPVQDFGNAYSTFVAQNHGAGNRERIRQGTRRAFLLSALFCGAISLLVVVLAPGLMGIFVKATEAEVIAAGVKYLRIEGACYLGIGCLFLLYGYFRGVKRAEISVVLTVISLGARVALAYALSGPWGETGIWLAIPIGWALADLAGMIAMRRGKERAPQ